MRVSWVNTGNYSIGEVVNMVATDANRFSMVTSYLAMMVVLPIQLIIGMVSIGVYLGVAIFPGVAVLFLTSIVTFILGKISKRQNEQYMEAKDKRLKTVAEIFNGVRFIKFNAWESKFLERLAEKRKNELHFLSRMFYRMIISIFWNWFSPALFLAVVLSYYSMVSGEMRLANIFASINAFSIMSESLKSLPYIRSFFFPTWSHYRLHCPSFALFFDDLSPLGVLSDCLE